MRTHYHTIALPPSSSLRGARPMIKEHAPVAHRSQTLRVVASGALSDVGRSLGDHSLPARHGFKTINSTPQHSALSGRMESIAAHLPNLKDQTHPPTHPLRDRSLVTGRGDYKMEKLGVSKLSAPHPLKTGYNFSHPPLI